MKNTIKIIKNILLAMSLVPLMVSSASAAATLYEASLANGTAVTVAQCPLLTSDVNVNLSTGVKGAVSCDEALGTVKVGTCSTGGSTKSQTVACTVTNQTEIDAGAPGAVAAVYNDSTCDGTAGQKFTAIGRNYFSMSTTGGSLAVATLSDTKDAACDDTTLLPLIKK